MTLGAYLDQQSDDLDIARAVDADVREQRWSAFVAEAKKRAAMMDWDQVLIITALALRRGTSGLEPTPGSWGAAVQAFAESEQTAGVLAALSRAMREAEAS